MKSIASLARRAKCVKPEMTLSLVSANSALSASFSKSESSLRPSTNASAQTRMFSSKAKGGTTPVSRKKKKAVVSEEEEVVVQPRVFVNFKAEAENALKVRLLFYYIIICWCLRLV